MIHAFVIHAFVSSHWRTRLAFSARSSGIGRRSGSVAGVKMREGEALFETSISVSTAVSSSPGCGFQSYARCNKPYFRHGHSKEWSSSTERGEDA